MARLQSAIKRVFIPSSNRWVVHGMDSSGQCARRTGTHESSVRNRRKIRFEGWFWRPLRIEEAAPWRSVGFDLQGGRDRAELRKRTTARPQSGARALPRGLGVHRRRIAIRHHRAAALVAGCRRKTGKCRASGPEGHNCQHQDRAFSTHGHSVTRTLTHSIFQQISACRDADHWDRAPKLGGKVRVTRNQSRGLS